MKQVLFILLFISGCGNFYSELPQADIERCFDYCKRNKQKISTLICEENGDVRCRCEDAFLGYKKEGAN
jgi:hypothetical protein